MTERTVPAADFAKMLTGNVDNEKLSDAQFREFVRNSLPIVIGAALPVGERRRPPQDPKRWPPSMTPEAIESCIDEKCGCTGNYNCECISVFNQARVDAWTEHNQRERKCRA